MGLKKIQEEFGENNFFSVREVSEKFRLPWKDVRRMLERGVELEILFQTNSTTSEIDDEFGFRENWSIKREKVKEYDRFIEDNFPLSKRKPVFLDEEETSLKENVLTRLSLRKRLEASELLSQDIEDKNFIYTTRDDKQSEMWIYQEGVYVPQGKTFVREYCRRILGAAYTTQLVNEVIAKIEADTFVEQDKFFKNTYIDEVVVENGLLNIKTKELKNFNPQKIFFNKIPIIYDPSANCPKITNHFKTVLRDEEDSKVMFELFGYLLLKESKFEKAFMFIGNGRNGKSKTLELMKKFVGIDNCSALPLKSLNTESFSISDLFGKMVNLAGDMSYEDLKDPGMLKMLTGRDEIQAKRKFLTDLKFVNFAKMIFACNELPRVYDTTDGFWGKWILLEFPYKFVPLKEFEKLPEDQREGKKIMDPDIIEDLTSPEELSGLLNESLYALERIISQKEFSYSKGTAEVKDIWMRQSDSFMAFCLDKLEEDSDSKISKKILRKQYYLYCKYHKLRSVSDKSIKITLEKMFGIVEYRTDSDRFWEGVKFKEMTGVTAFSSSYQKKNLPIDIKKDAKGVTNLNLNEKIESDSLDFWTP